MSSGIEKHDSLFLGSGLDAWHKLGNVVQGRLTAADAIDASGLGWRVGLAPAYALINGEHVEVEDRFHTYREDIGLVLGTVGARYTPVQNAELFDFLDNIVDSGEAHYETAGSLKNGRIVWLLLQPDESEVTIGGDPFKQYLLATTAHDGSAAVRVKPVVTRVVCANTLGWALGEKSNTFSARHTASASGKVAEARAALDIGFTYFAEFEEDVKRLQAIDFEIDEFDAFLQELVPIEADEPEGRKRTIRENTRAGIRSVFFGEQVQGQEKNGWGVVQAVNGFEQWGQTVKGDRFERQALNAISGNSPLTAKARELVLA